MNLSPVRFSSQTTCFGKIAASPSVPERLEFLALWISFLISWFVNFSGISSIGLKMVSILIEGLFWSGLTSQSIEFVMKIFSKLSCTSFSIICGVIRFSVQASSLAFPEILLEENKCPYRILFSGDSLFGFVLAFLFLSSYSLDGFCIT